MKHISIEHWLKGPGGAWAETAFSCDENGHGNWITVTHDGKWNLASGDKRTALAVHIWTQCESKSRPWNWYHMIPLMSCSMYLQRRWLRFGMENPLSQMGKSSTLRMSSSPVLSMIISAVDTYPYFHVRVLFRICVTWEQGSRVSAAMASIPPHGEPQSI
jgi:hypothetical protein